MAETIEKVQYFYTEVADQPGLKEPSFVTGLPMPLGVLKCPQRSSTSSSRNCPRWWEGWQENLRPYRIALQAAIGEAALAENLVYYGHVGHGLLPGIRHVVRVLLTAPMEIRLEMVRLRQGLTATAARRYIQHVDKARAPADGHVRLGLARPRAIRHGCESGASECRPAAQNMIAHAAKLRGYQATDVSRQALADLALSSRVQAQLPTYPTLRNSPISVKASDGEITLSGLYRQFPRVKSPGMLR